jgi:hypothetical protein
MSEKLPDPDPDLIDWQESIGAPLWPVVVIVIGIVIAIIIGLR